MPSVTAIVYRVSYRRDGWKDGVWKNKLFNSEGAATKYAGNLLTPITDDTPEKFRKLKPATVRITYGMVRWDALPDADGVVALQAAVEHLTTEQAEHRRVYHLVYPESEDEPSFEEAERVYNIWKES